MINYKSEKARIFWSLVGKSLCGANMFMIPYIQYVYYNDLVSSLGIAKSQVGVLLMVFTITATILYIPGGWIVDKTNPKTMMVISALSTGAVGLFAAFTMNYTAFIIAWVFFGATTSMVWMGASIKSVRMLAPAGAIAKTYATSSLISLVAATLIGFLGTFVYSKFEGTPNAFRNVIIMYAVLIILSGLFTQIFFQLPKEYVELSKKDPVSKDLVMKTLKSPVTWALAGICFFCYSFLAGASYFTPFFVDVYGFNPNASNVFGVIRNYGVAIVFVPLAGWLSDKFGSVSKIIVSILLACSAILVGIIFGANALTISIMIAVSLIFAAAGRVLECLQFATPAEAGITTAVAGVVGSVSSMIGYLPDLYIHQVYGAWLDKFSNTGYTYIFISMLVFALCGAGCAFYIIRVSKKLNAKNLENAKA